MAEEWRRVVGFDGYEVSSAGRIRSWRGVNGKPRADPVTLKPERSYNGYLRVRLARDGKSVFVSISRAVLTAFVGPCPDGFEACHISGNKSDNSMANLRWDSHRNNILDKHAHGTIARGERNGNSRLSDAEALEVIGLIEAGEPLAVISKKTGATLATVSDIAHGRTRKWMRCSNG